MVRNVVVGAEKKIKIIKAEVQPARVSHHPKILLVMLVGNPSKQMAGSGGGFQYE